MVLGDGTSRWLEMGGVRGAERAEGERREGGAGPVDDPMTRWPRTVAEAQRVQARLRRRLREGGGPRRVRLVAGTDCAFSRDGRKIFAGIVVVALPDLAPVASVSASGPVTFPYVPGYLSFREGPTVLRAAGRLRTRPDLWLFDGQGIAHPRGFGLAAHIGVLLDAPSVGCAKSRLVGSHLTPGPRRGDWMPLELDGRRVGVVLRTRDGVRPLYVSVGQRMRLSAARRWVLACCRHRVPEPIRLAEHLVNSLKREADR